MQRQIAFLTAQLQNARAQNNQVQPAGFQQPVRLQPRSNSPMPLAPATAPKITTKYYVGDMMAPPFAGATLKLMQFIKANVDPESWSDSKMMQITEPSISLEITQTRDNHERISELLRQVRIGAISYQPTTQRR